MIKRVNDKYKNLPIQAKASLCFLISSVFQKGISTLTTPIFTRLLTTAEYGQYTTFVSWMNVISVFVTLRITYGVYTQGLIKFQKDQAVFSSSMQGLILVLSGISTLIYILFRQFWNRLFGLTTVQMLTMFLLIWTTSVFELWVSEQHVKYNYKQLVAVTILSSVLKPLIGIWFVIVAEDKVTARIVGLALVEVVVFSGFFWIQFSRGKRLFSLKYWKYALRFNIPLVPHYLSQTVLNSSDRIMIANLIGNAEAGIYSLAFSISMLMLIINTSIMKALSPWIYKKIRDNESSEIAGIAYLSLIIVAIMNVVLIGIAPEAIAVFAPTSYSDAIWVIPPIAMSVYFMFCYDLFAKFELYYEKTHYTLFISLGGAVLNVFLNFVFIKKFGYLAAGYTTLICYIVYTFCHYVIMKKVCKECNDIPQVFNKWIIMAISITFIIVGFVFMFVYKVFYVRYAALFIVVICMYQYRNVILNSISKLK